jgi:O-antigen/teichoic acid export membrane protein
MVNQRFSAGGDVIPLVALAHVFCGLAYYVQLGMFLTSRTHLIGIISAAAAVLNLGLNYVLILQFGMKGAACATLLSYLAIGVGSRCFSQRVLSLPLSLGRVGAAMLVGAALYALSRWWNPASLPVALLGKGVLLALYPVVLWKTGILAPDEAQTIASVARNAAAKLPWLRPRFREAD